MRSSGSNIFVSGTRRVPLPAAHGVRRKKGDWLRGTSWFAVGNALRGVPGAAQETERHGGRSLQRPSLAAKGFTLIELLVVIAIMMTLMALAARQMRPAVDSRRIREAARAVNVYLGSARNTAMVNRRPCGVVLYPTPGAGMTMMVMTLEQAEVPPPYAGDDASATAQVLSTSTPNVFTATLTSLNSNLVHNLDTIQFNNQGPWYTINGILPSSTTVTLSLYLDWTQDPSFAWTLNQATPSPVVPWGTSWPTGLPGVPYRIYRQPFSGNGTKSVATPVQLPAGAVIDLGWSGTDASSFSVNGSPIYIMFNAAGAVDRVVGGGFSGSVSQPIFLLVGKPAAARGIAGTTPGYQDPENLWVVINPQTGLVTTAPVAVGSDLPSSRLLARDAQGVGGR
jgi:prepilin-type N-terminal cleavage/methylation domain-containing protein